MRTAVDDLEDFAKAVQILAFKMDAPNEFTPIFVQMAVAALRCVRNHREKSLDELTKLSEELDLYENE